MNKKLHLGCGRTYKEGWMNVDINKSYKTDMICDLEQPLPFIDERFDEVLCWGVLEHVKNYVQLMEEISRVLQPGGILRFRVPVAGTVTDYISPDHISRMTPQTMMFFTDKTPAQFHTNKCKFKIINLSVTTPGKHLIFPWRFFMLNSFVNNLFTGIEGVYKKK